MKIQLKAATYLLFLFGLISCGSDPYLYNRYQTPPVPNQVNQNQDTRVAPDYYRQGQQMPPQQNYQPDQYQQQCQQPPYQQPQPPQPPQYQQPYQSPYQQRGGSRSHSNPYSMPPSSHYPSYPAYDVDQYYVPPTNYYGYDQDNVTEKHY